MEPDSYFSWSSSVVLLTNKTADGDIKFVHLSVTLENFPKNDPGANLVYYKLSLSNKIAFNPYQQWVKMKSPRKLTQKQVIWFFRIQTQHCSLQLKSWKLTCLNVSFKWKRNLELDIFSLVWLGYYSKHLRYSMHDNPITINSELHFNSSVVVVPRSLN